MFCFECEVLDKCPCVDSGGCTKAIVIELYVLANILFRS